MVERVYSNSVNIETSLYDFCFKFGLRDREQGEKNESDLVASLFMSPQHAKSFFLLLEQNIKAYENQLGEIKLPDEILKQLSSPQK